MSNNMGIFDIEMMILLCIHHEIKVEFNMFGIVLKKYEGEREICEVHNLEDLVTHKASLRDLVEQFVKKVQYEA